MSSLWVTFDDDRPPLELVGVIGLDVEHPGGDQRTQAERNADNALAAARLARVERELQDLIARVWSMDPSVRVKAGDVQTSLERCLDAPIEP